MDVICQVTVLMGGRVRVTKRWWGLKDISPGRVIIFRKECEVLMGFLVKMRIDGQNYFNDSAWHQDVYQ